MNVSEKTESLRADTLSIVDFSMSLAMKMRDSQKISQKNESPFQGNFFVPLAKGVFIWISSMPHN